MTCVLCWLQMSVYLELYHANALPVVKCGNSSFRSTLIFISLKTKHAISDDFYLPAALGTPVMDSDSVLLLSCSCRKFRSNNAADCAIWAEQQMYWHFNFLLCFAEIWVITKSVRFQQRHLMGHCLLMKCKPASCKALDDLKILASNVYSRLCCGFSGWIHCSRYQKQPPCNAQCTQVVIPPTGTHWLSSWRDLCFLGCIPYQSIGFTENCTEHTLFWLQADTCVNFADHLMTISSFRRYQHLFLKK